MYEKERDFASNILSAFDLAPDEIEDLCFTARSGSVNWSKVVNADIEKVVKEKHFISLKENVFNIIHYDLDSTSSANILDPGFVKLFRLAQLTIEYLLCVHKYLRKRVDRLNEKEKIAMQASENMTNDQNVSASVLNEMKNISNKNSSLRKGHRIVVFENEINNIFQCSICGKVFLDEFYLTAHQQRRHTSLHYPTIPEISKVKSSVSSNIPENTSNLLQKETEKIWKELEDLRERVNDCESCNTRKEMIAGRESKKGEVEEKLGRNQDELIKEKAVDEEPMEKGHSDEKQMKNLRKENLKAEVDYQNESEEPPRVRDNGRLEAQERVWRGRLKALADESTREIESLRKMITSYQEKEHTLVEEYKEKIEKLTSQLKEQSTRQFEADAAETVEPEVMTIASTAEDLQSPPSSSDSVDTSAPSIQLDNEGRIEFNSTFTYAANEKNISTDSEVDSSEISNSSIIERLPENQGSDVEFDSRAVTIEIFNQKLKYLGINPKTKKIPEKVFKEKLEVIHKQQKDMAKNIEGYYQIKSNIEEKALAKVSQRLQRPDSKHSRLQDGFPDTDQTSTIISTPAKRKNFEPLEFSSKNTSARTTSRSLSSNHSPRLRAKASVIKSVVMVDTSSKSRPWVSVPGPKSNKGMGTLTSYVHPKVQEKSVFPASSAVRTIGPRECHGFSSGGGILRGLPSQPSDGEGDKKLSTHSLGNVGNKSVSFSFAQNVIPGKVYKAQ